MQSSNQFDAENWEEMLLSTTGEPTDQLGPEENEDDTDQDLEDDDLDTSQADFDDEPMEDDEDLDEDEVKRLFPGEDDYTKDDDDEPYEGIHSEDDEDEGLADDNMSGMPVIPSPS